MEKLAWFEDSLSLWQARATAIRSTILSGALLEPLPARNHLHPVFANRRIREGYSVEDVAFEAMPGFYVFANLYRLLHPQARVPGIPVAHGHFRQPGWYARTRPENQVLCATIAQMGAVVFTWDMVGWGDSRQLTHHARQVLRYQLWDSIRSVDFLLTLPEVDPSRIGITVPPVGLRKRSFLLPLIPALRPACPWS
jgi:uncharacterized protein